MSLLDVQPLISKDFSYACNILDNVFPYLEVQDLVSCSQVCMVWRDAVMRSHFWSHYVVKCCAAHTENLSKDLLASTQKLHIEVDYSVDEQKVSELLQLANDSGNEVSELSLCSPKFSNISSFSKSLTTLSLVLCSQINLRDLQGLTHLTNLYVDADYSKGFFEPVHHFLKKLVSFGVGFTCYHDSPGFVSLCCMKLSELFTGVLRNITRLKLRGLVSDFLILTSVSKHPNVKHLDIDLSLAWSYYSAFLAKCSNIKTLSITLTCPRYTVFGLKQLAALNTILVQTVLELASNLEEFHWTFDTAYMFESEQTVALAKNWNKPGFTAIFQIPCVNLCSLSSINLQRAILTCGVRSLSLDELKEVLQKEMPSRIYVGSNKYEKKCMFCPIVEEEEIMVQPLLKIIRRDRLRAQRIRKITQRKYRNRNAR